jgi:uncharacterized protein YecT (DUF1311 family)
MKIAPVISVLLTLARPAAHAGDQGDPAANCDGSTQDMVECLAAQTAQWDKRLGAVYREAMQAAPAPQREQLRAAERLWIQYRDANCEYYALGEGTIARLNAAACQLRMRQERARELKAGGASPDNPGNEDRD